MIYPVGVTETNPLVVFAAHSDIVFGDLEPLPLTVEGGLIKCPGVGDDTANLVMLLMAAKYIAENKIVPKSCGMLLVANSGEEGLGNLKGSRQLIKNFGHRMKEFVSFDCTAHALINGAVGSKRFKVEVKTEGGHSFSNFGNKNAIAYLSAMIQDLYQIQVPEKGVTTYNVGTISGGTSVNTIAQQAEMLYEFRSDEKESIEIMEEKFYAIIEAYREKEIEVNVTIVGERPCSAEVDQKVQAAMAARMTAAISRYFGWQPAPSKASTDCNIPLAAGIPAVCTGCILGEGAHTREEYVEIESLLPGLKVAFELILYYF
ncbi:MAG: M20/M25/M40 family metallo-hydrolase [Firmicutes bacterium]|nr:M20/M25/M40 family metallo-hydrolase [Bacillota bacterium]